MGIPAILLIIILIVGVLIARVTLRNKFVFGKQIKILFCSYVVVLLISLIVSLILPKQVGTLPKPIETDGIPTLYTFLDEEDQWDMEGLEKYKFDEAEFPFNEEELHLYADGFTYVIEERQDTENKLDIAHYRTSTFVNGIDISQEIPELIYEVNDQGLYINLDEQVDLEIRQQPFPYRLFSEKHSNNESYMDVHFGDELFYITVPEHVTVIYEEYMNVYFNEQ
ncbi:hypothetical protein AB4Y30_02135 [Ornithinibacillus sp. 4-3]|uniref:Uncharacterized protein n=1 Tax=Ornithinibacillus sp. 4-3 TaxID=3231488 RepID=A0AB39HRT3_9BACI